MFYIFDLFGVLKSFIKEDYSSSFKSKYSLTIVAAAITIASKIVGGIIVMPLK